LRNPNHIYVGQRLIIPGSGEPDYWPRTHIVQQGENLYRIALRYGVSMGALVRANNLRNPNRIYVGQRLIIPGSPGEPIYRPQTHIVQRGENLYRIALRYGVNVRALAVVNGIVDINRIYVGQRLLIPDADFFPPPFEWLDLEWEQDMDGVDWFTITAGIVGLTEDTLWEKLEAGQSIAQIAQERGVDPQKVVDGIVAAEKEFVTGLVTTGELSQKEADEWLAGLVEEVHSFVESN